MNPPWYRFPLSVPLLPAARGHLVKIRFSRHIWKRLVSLSLSQREGTGAGLGVLGKALGTAATLGSTREPQTLRKAIGEKGGSAARFIITVNYRG